VTPRGPAKPSDDERRRRRHERLEAFEEALEAAAVEAELETGRREETPEEVRRSLRRRVASMIGGTFLIIAGIVMLVIPGPGLLAIVIGLGLIAPDVPFAARLLERLKERLPQDADGGIPNHVIAMMVVTAVAFTSLSLWWSFLR
jgi:cation:H+ antiporter